MMTTVYNALFYEFIWLKSTWIFCQYLIVLPTIKLTILIGKFLSAVNSHCGTIILVLSLSTIIPSSNSRTSKTSAVLSCSN